MKVYVLTSGEYSDYGIECVVLEKEKAERLVKAHPYWMIEEYDTDDVQIFEKYVYRVQLFDDGSCHVYEDSISRWTKIQLNQVFRYGLGRVRGQYWQVYVEAQDSEHAKKIAYDLIAEYKYP